MEPSPLLEARPNPDLIRLIYVQWHIKMHKSCVDIEFALHMKPKHITQEGKKAMRVRTLHTADIRLSPQLCQPRLSITTALIPRTQVRGHH